MLKTYVPISYLKTNEYDNITLHCINLSFTNQRRVQKNLVGVGVGGYFKLTCMYFHNSALLHSWCVVGCIPYCVM